MAQRANGANPLTIQGGHVLDLLEFTVGVVEVGDARLATMNRTWLTGDRGDPISASSPHSCLIQGVIAGRAELSVSIRAVPHGADGFRQSVYGTDGVLILEGPTVPSMGPMTLRIVRGSGEPKPVDVDTGTPPGLPQAAINVWHAYDGWVHSGVGTLPRVPDFEHALRLHETLASVERLAGW